VAKQRTLYLLIAVPRMDRADRAIHAIKKSEPIRRRMQGRICYASPSCCPAAWQKIMDYAKGQTLPAAVLAKPVNKIVACLAPLVDEQQLSQFLDENGIAPWSAKQQRSSS
jgi:hypothetical protein